MTTIALQERVPISYSLEYIFSFTGRGATEPEAIGPLADLPPAAQVRISPRFYTSHRGYLWLNRLRCAGIDEYIPTERCVNYDVYAVR